MDGITFYYFTLRTIISLVIFIIWGQFDRTYNRVGWDLFLNLFLIMFLSTIFARVISYFVLYFLTRQTKRTIPSVYEINFRNKINNLSIVSILAMLLSALIYAWGFNWLILSAFFPEVTIITYFVTYLIIKIGTYVISWILFKII